MTEQELAMLAFEKQWWKTPGSKEQQIRTEFGLNTTRYYQLLNQLIDKPAALQAEPMVVLRLRRLRDRRGAARAAFLRRPMG